MLPAVRFQSWRSAEKYFLDLGAYPAEIERVARELKGKDLAILVIGLGDTLAIDLLIKASKEKHALHKASTTTAIGGLGSSSV